jgi:hypothetical protein
VRTPYGLFNQLGVLVTSVRVVEGGWMGSGRSGLIDYQFVGGSADLRPVTNKHSNLTLLAQHSTQHTSHITLDDRALEFITRECTRLVGLDR